jgi:hypothetical protein
MQVWMRSYQFRISGLDRQALEPKVVSACRSGGDFLRVVMDEIAWRQQVSRWAVWGPDNLLHMADIASELPDALFLHIVRDGRDVALSMSKEGWIRPFPWDRQRGLLVAALHWQWKVRYGRRSGRALKHRYLEVRFEDLLTKPEDTLSTIGRFIDQPLSYATIQREAIGTLKDPNSTFRNSGTDLEKPNPVGRWKKALSESDISLLEDSIGSLLEELGYPLALQREEQNDALSSRVTRTLYPAFFSTKEWLRSRTPLGRLVSVERLRLDQRQSFPNA